MGKAIAHYEKSLEFFPENHKVLYRLENFFDQNKLTDGNKLREALAINSKNDEAHFYLAKILTSDEDGTLAKKHFYKALEINPESPKLI